MRHIVTCGLPGSTIVFLHCLLKGTIFAKTSLTLTPRMWRIWWAPNNASNWKMGFNSTFKELNAECVSIFSTTFVSNIFPSKKNWERCDKKIHIGLHGGYPVFLPDFNENWIFLTDFRKITNYGTFNLMKNLFSWSQVVPCGRMDGRTVGCTSNETTNLNIRFQRFVEHV